MSRLGRWLWALGSRLASWSDRPKSARPRWYAADDPPDDGLPR